MTIKFTMSKDFPEHLLRRVNALGAWRRGGERVEDSRRDQFSPRPCQDLIRAPVRVLWYFPFRQ